MIRRITTLFLITCALAMASVPARAQMSDDAVIAYVKEGMASGKSQEDLMKELAVKGVTQQQAERIRDRVEKEQSTQGVKGLAAVNRERNRNIAEGDADMDLVMTVTEVVDSNKVLVYGRDIFTNENLTFMPNENIPTPPDYKLGPGDEIIIDIWGNNQTTIRQVLSPDGTINIPDVGLVSLNGMTVKEADSYLRKKLGQIYAVDGEDAKSEIKLTLGSIRSIQVNVMGEVTVPGTYFLSSLSTLYHALYRAGGVTDLGTLRNIKLVRKGKTIAEVDVYDFILNGKVQDSVNLEDGDIVIVPAYDKLVEIVGKVKRPMIYEMKEGETLADLIEYTGGFSGDAYKDNVNLVRQNGKEYQVYTVDAPDFAAFEVFDGDAVTVGAMLDRYTNKLEIKGAVYRPGIYQLGNGVETVGDLIRKADGLMGDAFTNRGIITRERDNLTFENIRFDIKAVLEGTAPDIPLQKNDIVYIASIHDLNEIGTITVEGEVSAPGVFTYADNTTLEDAIMLAGGLLESSSTVKIDLYRRIKSPQSTTPPDVVGEEYTLTFKDGYVIDGEGDFILQPYDHIMVRRSPGYEEQRTVRSTGELVFPGTYAISKKEERLSDLVAKSGGLTQWAYVKGARLQRTMNPEEKTRMQSTIDVVSSAKDSINVENLDLADKYFVGIDLQAALASPGSDADLVLREGDVLAVPEYNNTVRISGNVLYPNTVTYNPNLSVKKYIEMAGGYGFRSKKNRVYIIYMNGNVAKARKGMTKVIEPGCEIVVPQKAVKEGQLQEILSVATTATSLATMMATITNIIK